MLAALGLATVGLLLVAILRKWLSPLLALILVPVMAALAGGFAGDVGGYIVDGVRAVAPMAAMFVFAILFFGVMSDAGLFAPFVNGVLRVVGHSPPRIAVGTVALASIVHLDGSGASTFLIAVPALRPLYDELGMDRRVLAATVALAAGINNMLPWGGPTIRAATSLNVDVMALYGPLVPVHLAGLLFAFGCALLLGLRERRRLAAGTPLSPPGAGFRPPVCPPETGRGQEDAPTGAGASPSPWRLGVNLLITVAVIGTMVTSLLHPMVAFMLGVVAALCVNYPGVEQQRQRVDAHARAALMMAAILFAAGAFAGIMQGTGMLDAMAAAGTTSIPAAAGSHLPVIIALLAMPLSFLFDPDSFYFGVLPVISQVAGASGASTVQVAQGALLGQMTTGFPVSPLTPATFLLVGLAGVDLADHQRFSIPLLFAASLVMTAVAVTLGVLVAQP